MTDFTPEHYLAAARISDNELRWFIQDDGAVYSREEDDGLGPHLFNPWLDDSDYRALREALDKEYGITISWNGTKKLWQSTGTGYGVSIGGDINRMFDEDTTNLMMKNVVALVEAGYGRFMYPEDENE